jgi:hypothetical protein
MQWLRIYFTAFSKIDVSVVFSTKRVVVTNVCKWTPAHPTFCRSMDQLWISLAWAQGKKLE